MSKRDRIFSHPLRTTDVTLPNGDVVEARSLGLTARSALTKASMADGEIDSTLLILNTIIACIHDKETGDKLFSIGDREAIGALGSEMTDPMFNAAAALNGMQIDAVEQAEKN